MKLSERSNSTPAILYYADTTEHSLFLKIVLFQAVWAQHQQTLLESTDLLHSTQERKDFLENQDS